MKRVLGVAGAALLLMTAAMGAWQGAGADRLNARTFEVRYLKDFDHKYKFQF